MLPVIRSLVSFAAGVARMPLGPFVLFTFLGSLPWTILLVFAGVQLGANWDSVGAVRQAVRVRHPGHPGRHRPGLDLVPDHQAAPAAGRVVSGAAS